MKKKFKVIWANSAVQDLEKIVAYIAVASPGNARKILAEIKSKASSLYHSPLRGRFVPELHDQGLLLYRELIIPPWRLMYRISDNKVFVLAVFDSRQNVEDILMARLINLNK